MEQTIGREFVIDGNSYRMPDGLSWQQNKWLGEHVFQGIDLQRLDYGTVHDLLREKGPVLMAICLVAVDMTRAQHSRLRWQDISLRAEEFAAALSGEEVAQFGPAFFQSCRPGSMAMLIPGKQVQAMLDQEMGGHAVEQGPVFGAGGLKAASSPLPMATLPSSPTSWPTGDQPSPSPISNGASSDRLLTAPSLGGSASNSPG